MPEQLIFTAFLNKYFGGIAASLLHMVGVQPTYPDAPITNPVAMEILVVLILLAFFVAVRASLSVDKPGGLQHLVEATEEFIAEQAHGVMGHGYERYIPYAVTIGFFILVGNLLGLVPGFESHSQPNRSARLRTSHVCLLPLSRAACSSTRVYQAVHRSGMAAGAPHAVD
jgi:F-type H+-transporting ATPase subunit a